MSEITINNSDVSIINNGLLSFGEIFLFLLF